MGNFGNISQIFGTSIATFWANFRVRALCTFMKTFLENFREVGLKTILRPVFHTGLETRKTQK